MEGFSLRSGLVSPVSVPTRHDQRLYTLYTTMQKALDTAQRALLIEFVCKVARGALDGVDNQAQVSDTRLHTSEQSDLLQYADPKRQHLRDPLSVNYLELRLLMRHRSRPALGSHHPRRPDHDQLQLQASLSSQHLHRSKQHQPVA